MSTDPWGPLGLALRDYFGGDRHAAVRVYVEDEKPELLFARDFFRDDGFPVLEETALDLCRGRVLDAGAGVGTHALALQERGLEVCALDVSPLAVEIMKKRGVRDPRRTDVFTLAGETFDTLLLMMNGIGIVGDTAGLDRFLGHARTLVREGGQMLLDSSDLRRADPVGDWAPETLRRGGGRHHAEVRFRMEYGDLRGAAFTWFFADPDVLRAAAEAHGWNFQVVFQQEEGEYLARLTPAE